MCLWNTSKITPQTRNQRLGNQTALVTFHQKLIKHLTANMTLQI